jgi:hypothetical protein
VREREREREREKNNRQAVGRSKVEVSLKFEEDSE